MSSNRVRKQLSAFTPVPNSLIDDMSLKPQSRFLYVYLNSRPENWEFYNKQLAGAMGCNEDTLRKYMNELIAAGWVSVKQIRNGGTFGNNEYFIFAVPQKTRDGSPYLEKTDTVKNRPVKSTTHNNKDLNNNKDLITKEGKSKKILTSTLFDEKENNTFRDSRIFNRTVFDSKFTNENEAGIDIVFYYHAVLDWSDKLPTRTKTQQDKALKTDNGWLAQVRTFMRIDKEKRKLKMIGGGRISEVDDMSDYFSRMEHR